MRNLIQLDTHRVLDRRGENNFGRVIAGSFQRRLDDKLATPVVPLVEGDVFDFGGGVRRAGELNQQHRDTDD